jgi:hypothetical protein
VEALPNEAAQLMLGTAESSASAERDE